MSYRLTPSSVETSSGLRSSEATAMQRYSQDTTWSNVPYRRVPSRPLRFSGLLGLVGGSMSTNEDNPGFSCWVL